MKRSIRLSAPLQFDSVVDGEGLRCVLWTQGCKHHCKGCHNPETHDFNGGFEAELEDLMQQMKERFYLDGITFSGGDPMEQAESCTVLAKYAHQLGWDVWCYTGYRYEVLIQLNNEEINQFLHEIDVLVDGPFIQEKRSLDILFRGSSNQRLIDVQESLKNKTIIQK